jgi:hypothetical protein
MLAFPWQRHATERKSPQAHFSYLHQTCRSTSEYDASMLPQQSSRILISHVNVTLGTDKTSESQHILNREMLLRFGQTFTKSVVWRLVTWPWHISLNFCKMIFRMTAGQRAERKITPQHPGMYCCGSPTPRIYGPCHENVGWKPISLHSNWKTWISSKFW